jgi:hypothetical protein
MQIQQSPAALEFSDLILDADLTLDKYSAGILVLAGIILNSIGYD